VVATCGSVGWVAVVIPQIARLTVGPNYKQLLPVSFFIGAIFLLVVDTICRSAFASEIPLGILTTLIGAPYFIFMFIAMQKNNWMDG
jgi:iron complex transport system permease protein